MTASSIFPGANVLAQSSPISPGFSDEFLRQQERERALREQQERQPDVHLPDRPSPLTPQEFQRLPEAENNCVAIKRITLSGDAADRFQWALAAADVLGDGSIDVATNRCLGTTGINLVMRRIRNAIVGRGSVTAQVLAGSQDKLASGQLELTLFPGRIHAIRFAAGTDPRATKWNALPVQAGDLLNLRDIEQALENFKRVPSVEADITLDAPQGPDIAPGQSDVVISWKQGFPLRLSISTDDSGTKATGKYQANVTVSYDHWWTLNDLFYLSLNHDVGGGEFGPRGAHGTHGYTAHYSLPFGYWLLALTSSSNQYHQSVAGASQTYLYSGESQNNEIRLSRLVYRDAARKTTLSLRGWSRYSKNFIDDTEVEVQRRRMAGFDVGVGHREFIAAATLDLNLDYRRGTGALEALRAPEEAFGEGTSRPKIFTADGQLSLPFTLAKQHWRYTSAWRAQWNKTALVAQDRFLIGGRYTVRGFDGENQLVAERGWLVRNELAWTLANTGQELYIGLDYGKVAGPSTAYLAGDHLSGAVIGLRGTVNSVFYDVFIGQPVSKPSGFVTSKGVAGFMLNWSI